MIPDASNMLMIVWAGVLSFSKETTIAMSLRALTGRILLFINGYILHDFFYIR